MAWKPYDPAENAARYEIQQRVWRLGRGEETEADRDGADAPQYRETTVYLL